MYGESNTEKINDKKYFWCPNHQAWTINHLDEYKLNMSNTGIIIVPTNSI